MKFRKKPVVIEATQWWPNAGIQHDGVWCDQEGPDAGKPYVITIHDQRAYLADGDWILPEPKPGHFYPCKPDIFEQIYEPTVETPATIDELERLLNSEDRRPVQINPDGTISEVAN